MSERKRPAHLPLVLVTTASTALLLAGCTAQSPTTENPISPTATTAAQPATPSPAPSWAEISQSGTGPTTITIPRPSPDAIYLMSTFSCTGDEHYLYLEEDPAVFKGGSCGGGDGGYLMPLPNGPTEFHIVIDLPADSTFTYTGRFEAGDRPGAAG